MLFMSVDCKYNENKNCFKYDKLIANVGSLPWWRVWGPEDETF